MTLRSRRQMLWVMCLALLAGTSRPFAAQPPAAKAHKQIKEFANWPKGASPEEIGHRVAERFAEGPHTNFGRSTPPAHITYPETCAWYGSLTFAHLAGDRALTAKLTSRFDPLFGDEAKLVPEPNHVDSTVFGAVPLELYL